MLAHLPAIASRAETLGARIEEAADKGFPLDERSIAAIGRAEAKRARWGNLALWIIAITLALIAARLI
jgi:ubiquinone biosynthesis protein